MAYSREEALRYVEVRERNILKNVYIWMTAGLALTGVVALSVSTNRAVMSALIGNPILFFGLIIGELALVMYLSARIQKMSASAATFAFAGYAVLNGITLSVIFLAYTGQTLAMAFFTTAATFGGMSLWAVTTKRDLSGWGHYLMMGLWGVLIASLVNMFFRSSGAYYLISYVGVLVFVGLTAYDTQMIKRWNAAYGSSVDEEQYVKLSIMGALKLYLDFINIFLFMLRIFGRRN